MTSQEHVERASAAWARMQAARASGNRRAENAAWREHQRETEAAARERAQENRWGVSATGFTS